MDDNTIPEDGMIEDPISEEPGTQEETSQEIQEPQSQYWTQQDAEAFWAQKSAELQQQFDAKLAQERRANQSKADRARENTVRKQQQFMRDTLPLLKEQGIELDGDTVARISNGIREREFWQPAEPEPEPISHTPTGGSPVTRQSLEQYLRDSGIDPARVDPKILNLNDFVGKPDNDPNVGTVFYDRVNRARAAIEAETQKQYQEAQRKAAAQRVASVRNNFGGTSTPQSSKGGESSAKALEEEMNELLRQQTGDQLEKMKNKQRRDEIEVELKKLGRWGKTH